MHSTTRISDTIVDQLESLILEGSLAAGERLPTERALAERFSVSRPTVRDALQKLASRGLVLRRQGGGTFVADGVGATFSDPLLELLAKGEANVDQVLEFRHALEGLAARLAAERATQEDRELITRKYSELVSTFGSGDLEAEAKADAAFHLAIAEAAHNPVLLHVCRTLFLLLRDNIVGNLGRLADNSAERQLIRDQHKRLLHHIVQVPNPEEARTSARDHLETVSSLVRDKKADIDRQEASRRRDLFRS